MTFTAIPGLIEHVMQAVQPEEMATLEDVLRMDTLARDVAREWLATQRKPHEKPLSIRL
jgi:1-deoxy-D-xylulose-5-phosphate reductoisomerase